MQEEQRVLGWMLGPVGLLGQQRAGGVESKGCVKIHNQQSAVKSLPESRGVTKPLRPTASAREDGIECFVLAAYCNSVLIKKNRPQEIGWQRTVE